MSVNELSEIAPKTKKKISEPPTHQRIKLKVCLKKFLTSMFRYIYCLILVNRGFTCVILRKNVLKYYIGYSLHRFMDYPT